VRLWFVFFMAAAVATGLTSGDASAQNAKRELLEKASAALAVCAEHLPNARAAREAYIAQGFRYEGADPDYNIYSLDGRRLLIGTTVTHSREPGCLVSVSRMTAAEAAAAAAEVIRLARAERDQQVPAGLSAAWTGTLRGRPVGIGIYDELYFGIMHGAAIVLVMQ
jgi:hypothetical protein